MWRNVKAIGVITLKESLRLKLMKAIITLALLMSLCNIFVANLFSWDLGKITAELGLSSSALVGLILVFFLSNKMFAEDLEKHSIYMVMARPVKYWHYIAGKYVGLGFVFLMVVMTFCTGSAISMQFIKLSQPAFVPPNFTWALFFMAFFFQWISLQVVLAVTFFWFSFAQQSFVALIISIMSYLVGQNLELLRQYVLRGDLSNLDIQQYVVIIISWIFPNLSFFDFKFVAAYGLSVDYQKIFFVFLYGISCTVIFLFLAAFFFKRKELP